MSGWFFGRGASESNSGSRVIRSAETNTKVGKGGKIGMFLSKFNFDGIMRRNSTTSMAIAVPISTSSVSSSNSSGRGGGPIDRETSLSTGKGKSSTLPRGKLRDMQGMESNYTPGGISSPGRGGWVGNSKTTTSSVGSNYQNSHKFTSRNNNDLDDTDSLEEFEYFEDFNLSLQPPGKPSPNNRSISLPAINTSSSSSSSSSSQSSSKLSTHTSYSGGNRLLKSKTVGMAVPSRPIQSEDLDNEMPPRHGKVGIYYSTPGNNQNQRLSKLSYPSAQAQILTQAAPIPTSASISSTSSSMSSTISTSKPASMQSTASTSSPPPASSKGEKLCCDKCDGNHETDACPYYKKSRDSHPDAQKNFYKKMGGTSKLPGSMLRMANVVRQPGDGSCLFHSMAYGLKDGSTASTLRSEVCQFIAANPNLKICETPLSDWVKWDSNQSCTEYARKMSRGSWGGGIEMACVSNMKRCNVHVYEKTFTGFKRISAFDYPVEPEKRKIVRVLYCGGVHYDALVASL